MSQAQYNHYMTLAAQYRQKGRTAIADALERQAQAELEKPAMDVSDVAMAEREKYNDPRAVAEYVPAQAQTTTPVEAATSITSSPSRTVTPAEGPWYNNAYNEGQQSYIPSLADQNQADAKLLENDNAYSLKDDPDVVDTSYDLLVPETPQATNPLVDPQTGGNYDKNWNANTLGISNSPTIAEQYAKQQAMMANAGNTQREPSIWDKISNTWTNTVKKKKEEEELAKLYSKGYPNQ